MSCVTMRTSWTLRRPLRRSQSRSAASEYPGGLDTLYSVGVHFIHNILCSLGCWWIHTHWPYTVAAGKSETNVSGFFLLNFFFSVQWVPGATKIKWWMTIIHALLFFFDGVHTPQVIVKMHVLQRQVWGQGRSEEEMVTHLHACWKQEVVSSYHMTQTQHFFKCCVLLGCCVNTSHCYQPGISNVFFFYGWFPADVRQIKITDYSRKDGFFVNRTNQVCKSAKT